ncbi:MAG: ribonuclease P [Nanoarchaeota archaeon]|nr:ribonuclease P [Nanoarchaeota archaeon]
MKPNKNELKKIALEKIKTLFNEARIQFNKNPSLSNRYITLARKIAMKFNLRIPRELKRRYCKHCYSYLVPNKNCRVRVHKSRVIYYCLNCKKFMRFVIKKK